MIENELGPGSHSRNRTGEANAQGLGPEESRYRKQEKESQRHQHNGPHALSLFPGYDGYHPKIQNWESQE